MELNYSAFCIFLKLYLNYLKIDKGIRKYKTRMFHYAQSEKTVQASVMETVFWKTFGDDLWPHFLEL